MTVTAMKLAKLLGRKQLMQLEVGMKGIGTIARQSKEFFNVAKPYKDAMALLSPFTPAISSIIGKITSGLADSLGDLSNEIVKIIQTEAFQDFLDTGVDAIIYIVDLLIDYGVPALMYIVDNVSDSLQAFATYAAEFITFMRSFFTGDFAEAAQNTSWIQRLSNFVVEVFK